MKPHPWLAAGIIIGAIIMVCITLAMPSLHTARIKFPQTLPDLQLLMSKHWP